MQSTINSRSIGGYENALRRVAGDEFLSATQSKDSAITLLEDALLLSIRDDFAGCRPFSDKFFSMRGTKSSMSVTV